MGRNDGHQRGDSVAAYGELSMATVTDPTHCQQELKSAPVSGIEKCTTAPVET
jgi:hypothetical protein